MVVSHDDAKVCVCLDVHVPCAICPVTYNLRPESHMMIPWSALCLDALAAAGGAPELQPLLLLPSVELTTMLWCLLLLLLLPLMMMQLLLSLSLAAVCLNVFVRRWCWGPC